MVMIFIEMMWQVYIYVKPNSQFDPLAFHICFRHFLVDAFPQWTSGLNLKEQEIYDPLNRTYLNPKDIFWRYSNLMDFQGFQPCPGYHDPIVRAQPGRGEDGLHVEVLGKPRQSFPHSKVACHAPGHHKVGR